MSDPLRTATTDHAARVNRLRGELDSLPTPEGEYPDEGAARLACGEAIDGLAEGNYGVGSVLVDPAGEVAARGHNQVFVPHFRSDRHSEMVALDAFEAAHPEIVDMSGYILHVSIEPCPMCLARLIIAGIGTVKYVTADEGGGMIRHLSAMPVNFRKLAHAQQFSPSACYPA
ncbi:MAG: nucleoside deaminase, partial [Bryobacteraceae bacterium]